MFCYQCGNQVEDTARFCRFCGAQFVVSDDSAAAGQTPQISYQQTAQQGTENTYQQAPSQGTENAYQQAPPQGTEGTYQQAPPQGTENTYQQAAQNSYQQGADGAAQQGTDGAYQQATQNTYQQAAQQGAQNTYQQTPQQTNVGYSVPKKSPGIDKKKLGIIIGIAAAAVILIVAMSIFMGTRKTTVKLKKYVTFETEGYDGYGTAVATFDRDKFIKDYGKKIKFTRKGKKAFSPKKGLFSFNKPKSEVTPAEYFLAYVSGELDKDSNLSNGDTINYVWDNDSDSITPFFKVKIDEEDVKYVVSGLDEIRSFDAFEGLTLTYSGISKEGSAEIAERKNDGAFQNLRYNIENNSGLSNGDEVTVTVTYDYYSKDDPEMFKQMAENYGEVPESFEKTFTVEGLPYYIATLAEIPEDTMSAMQKQMTDYISAKVARDWNTETENFKGAEYQGAYLLISKEGVGENFAFLVYKINGWNEEDGDFSFYTYIRFSNLKIVDGGLCDVDLTSYEVASGSIDFGSGFYYHGFKNLDEVFSYCVTQNLEHYTYDSSFDK